MSARPRPWSSGWETSRRRSIFSFAVDQEYIRADAHPVKKVTVKKSETKKERVLVPNEETQLLAVCRNPAHPRLAYPEPIIITALNTGVREGEILSLRWRSVDLTELRRRRWGSEALRQSQRHGFAA